MNEMDGMEGIIGEFLVEANEELDQFDRDLIELEKDPTSATLLARIFRAIPLLSKIKDNEIHLTDTRDG